MPADNWAICPRCKEKKEQAYDDLQDQVATDYGKVPADQYLELVKKAKEPIEFENTLREDYEIGIWEGKFEIHYCAGCIECGFSHKFKHDKQVYNVASKTAN